jgi:hypothetical protein
LGFTFITSIISSVIFIETYLLNYESFMKTERE